MEYLQYKTRLEVIKIGAEVDVLNLIINGIPSILEFDKRYKPDPDKVLNLIINGIPSIHEIKNDNKNNKP